MNVWKVFAFVIAGLLLASPADAARRNVIIFITDDQGQDSIGAYGNPVIKTPNVDKLAAEGTIYPYAFCTTASCSASRSVVLSGLFNHANAHYGHQHAYHHFSAYSSIRGLPVLLQEGGYRTARIGKYHVAPEKVYHFQTVIGPANLRNPVQMAEACRPFLTEKSDQPFFLYFATGDPHRGGGDADELPYRPNRFGNPAPLQSHPGVDEVKYDPRDVIVPPFLPDTPECRAEIAQYYQSCSRIDQGVGRLVQILKDTGHYDDTLIIYMSDHGMAFPGGKTTVYEGGMRSPLIVRHPYIPEKAVTSRAMVSWIDIVPTVLDFTGVLGKSVWAANQQRPQGLEVAPRRGKGKAKAAPRRGGEDAEGGQQYAGPYQLHGRSFLPTIGQKDPAGWDSVYASHTFHEITMYYPMKVVRERKYKLIWNIAHPLPYPFASDLWAAPTWQSAWKQGPDARYGQKTVRDYIQRPQFELYDVELDPWEGKNLAADPKYASVLQELKDKLKAFQQRTDDPWILKWEYE